MQGTEGLARSWQMHVYNQQCCLLGLVLLYIYSVMPSEALAEWEKAERRRRNDKKKVFQAFKGTWNNIGEGLGRTKHREVRKIEEVDEEKGALKPEEQAKRGMSCKKCFFMRGKKAERRWEGALCNREEKQNKTERMSWKERIWGSDGCWCFVLGYRTKAVKSVSVVGWR